MYFERKADEPQHSLYTSGDSLMHYTQPSTACVFSLSLSLSHPLPSPTRKITV
jgi:hypothetical protein